MMPCSPVIKKYPLSTEKEQAHLEKAYRNLLKSIPILQHNVREQQMKAEAVLPSLNFNKCSNSSRLISYASGLGLLVNARPTENICGNSTCPKTPQEYPKEGRLKPFFANNVDIPFARARRLRPCPRKAMVCSGKQYTYFAVIDLAA